MPKSRVSSSRSRTCGKTGAASSSRSQACALSSPTRESQLLGAQGNLDQWRGESATAQQTLAARDAALADESEKLPLAEEAYRASSNRRDELQHALARAEQALHIERTKLEHAGRVLEQLAQREERLREEQSALPVSDDAALEALRAEAHALEAALQTQRATLAENERALPQLEQALRARTEALDAASQRLTGLEARIHALTQLQDRIARGAELQGWLAARKLDQAPRLWQGIAIEPGWEVALEAVLRERLNGIAVEDLERAAEWLADSPPGKMTIVDASGSSAPAPAFEMPGVESLQRYVTCRDTRLEGVLREWLYQVYVVTDAAAGLAQRGQVPVGAMLVTREGHIYTRHSVSFHAADSELHGVLSRQREIEQLQANLGAERDALASAQSEVAAAEDAIERQKAALVGLRESVTQAQQRHHAMQMEALRRSEQAQRLALRGEQITLELAEVTAQTETEAEHRRQASAQLARLEEECGETRSQLERETEGYRRADSVVTLQREAVQKAQREQQEALYQARSAEAKIAEIDGSIRMLTEQTGALTAALAAEEQALAGCDETPWQAQLQQALQTRSEREQALARARNAVEGMETNLKEVEQERLGAEQRLGPLRERTQEVRLKEQEARLTEEQYARQLIESGADEAALQGLLEKGTRSGALQAEIARLSEEIKTLGAVNLAALEELETAQERKTYLDAQSQDLTEAMTTLEDAIRRIDRETRERLQTTFDEVNGHFSRMFPALFGGGNAKLVLTGEEILDSGVQVIAQPPGKKNSSIHLLSGGEKALTALALVFSMFQLNPAPFCLLDEVDAPLDDHNTGRFCDLVKKMSESSQFLFISHNKITMEIANQLLGITMQEPGVSRVVAVDIQEAMKLTEEAAA